MSTMQVVHMHAHGGPEVLKVEEIERPEPGPGEALVRVLGVSVNHLDLWVRRGMPGVKIPFPRIPGSDGTGEVVALGPDTNGPAPGTRVVIEPGMSSGKSPEDECGMDHLAPDYGIRGEHCDGLDREYVAVETRYLLPLPEGVDPVQAASVPLVFVTAYGMLVTRARLQAGETVLVLGGASGVGSAAIQIAKERGARVIATAGSEEKRRLAAELGAEEVLDHCQEGWGQEVKRWSERRGVDVVFEHVGPATWKTSMGVLARGGRLVTCGGTTGPMVQVALPHLFIKNQSILGATMGPRTAFPEIFAKLAAGAYRPVVDRVMALSEVQEAHRLLEDRAVVGKIVLLPGK
ncbi:MAG: alcohol dehydrogenase [Planctomycetes bacterium]|jgi:NADPH:quinone reductase-like Zn-dependent oxidoreductase|nr:alcohol dehydrogenase [Planctomycetota bacterium]